MKNCTPRTCPVCGSIVEERKLLFHLSRIHKKDGFEKFRMYCETVFGKENTEDLIKQYKDGKFCAYDLTSKGWKYANLIEYMRLLGVLRTSSQERHTDRYKSKYLNSIQKKYGYGIQNVSQVKEVQEKKEIAFARRYGSYEEYCNNAVMKMRDASKKKWSEDLEYRRRMTERMKGDGNIARIPSVAKKLSESQRNRNRNKTKEERKGMVSAARKAMQENRKSDFYKLSSRIERRVFNCVSSLYASVDSDRRMFGYVWDIVINDIKTIIEVQGDFFHANPKKYAGTDVIMTYKGKCRTAQDIWNRDNHRKEVATSNGYRFVEIWESDIRRCANEEELVNLIKGKITGK